MPGRFIRFLQSLFVFRWMAVHRHGTRFPPLLSEHKLHQLRKQAANSQHDDLVALREIQQPLLGEKDSSFSGSGYEFAEHRAYVGGDPVRHINWRIYARTGQLVRKVFHEQRRPQLYLLVDRRASMRFGTRTRLKVTAAVMHALTNIYQAQHLQIQVGAYVLDDRLRYFPPRQGEHALLELVEHLVSPCPPLQENNTGSLLMDALDLLAVQQGKGNLIFIYSDFIDYQPQMDKRLYAIGMQHTVIANHILDDAEVHLPAPGHYLIQLPDQQESSAQTTNLDCNDNRQRQQQQHMLDKYVAAIKQALQAADIRYRRIISSALQTTAIQTSHEPALTDQGQRRYG